MIVTYFLLTTGLGVLSYLIKLLIDIIWEFSTNLSNALRGAGSRVNKNYKKMIKNTPVSNERCWYCFI
tara:strand:+ start:1600 stop:1803 length:204 start_codon:yes stop_codon:yes gene_type:complete